MSQGRAVGEGQSLGSDEPTLKKDHPRVEEVITDRTDVQYSDERRAICPFSKYHPSLHLPTVEQLRWGGEIALYAHFYTPINSPWICGRLRRAHRAKYEPHQNPHGG